MQASGAHPPGRGMVTAEQLVQGQGEGRAAREARSMSASWQASAPTPIMAIIFAALLGAEKPRTANERTDVAELVDALALGASTARCGGSIPPVRTGAGPMNGSDTMVINTARTPRIKNECIPDEH